MIANHTKRIFLRKSLALFRVSFFADAGNTIPLVPLDSGKYPCYTIYDIHNKPVQSGIGQAENSPGTYKVAFQVPQDAPLSFDNNRWRIEWTMVSENNRQVSFVEDFDVKDTAVTQSATREQKYITLRGQDTRVMVRLTSCPVELSVSVHLAGSDCVIAHADLNAEIYKAPDGDSIVFYYDIPGRALNNHQFFSVIWRIREKSHDIGEFIYQSLTAITPTTLNYITALRMVVDKFQKRLGTVQAYEDSDLVEYLERGHELTNAAYPTTYYGFGQLPSALNPFLILFAGIWALNAQHMLETDLGFNFSGQTVTLDYDHGSQIADILARYQEIIDKNLAAAKMSIVRRTRPVGTVAGRGYRYNALDAYTFKIGHVAGGANLIQTLTFLGVLF